MKNKANTKIKSKSLKIFVILFSMVFIGNVISILEDTTVRAEGSHLVGYWSFDEGTGITAADSSGNGNTGSLVNSPYWIDGKSGKALSFDGTDNRVFEVLNTPVMEQIPLSLSAWVRPNLRTDGTDFPSNVISNDEPGSYGHGFGVNVWSGGSQMKVECQNAWRTIPGVNFSAGVWYYVTVVYTDGNVKSYVNSQLADNFSYSQAPMYTGGHDHVFIGLHNEDYFTYGTRSYFSGTIDEVRIYNRSLSQQDLQTDMEYISSNTYTPQVSISYPGDFFSAFYFVMSADNLMFVLISMWVIGLTYMLWKIFFGSLFGLIFGSVKATYHGESLGQYKGRAIQAYMSIGAFFAGLFMGGLWLTLPPNNKIFTGLIGTTFFLALWLFQVTRRNNESRSKTSMKNRFLGVTGIFSWQFGSVFYSYGIPMTQHLGLLYSSGWWVILITTLLLIGVVLIVYLLLRLYMRSFILTAHGCNQKTYVPKSDENVHIEYSIFYPNGQIRGDSDRARCTLCSHNVKNQGGGEYCPTCYYTVCRGCMYKGFAVGENNTCPKCHTPMFEIANRYGRKLRPF